MWHNEEFLAPFFLEHYRFADKIHVFMGADTTDKTREIIDSKNELCKNIMVHRCDFPANKLDDNLKITTINCFYRTLDCDYVILVDADEFIFYPTGYLDKYGGLVHFTKLWNVYRHITDSDLDPFVPIREQRRHGVSDYFGYDLYTKPNIVKAKQNFYWLAGHHVCSINGTIVRWNHPRGYFPVGVGQMVPLTGAHWAMADPAFTLERRIKERQERLSDVNKKGGLGVFPTQTEMSLRQILQQHEHDPLVF